jgi:uncharacterized membrane protein
MILADTLELIHILCVFLLLGALGMITYSSVMSAKTDDVRKFEIYQAIGSTGGMLAGIMSLFVGVFGTLTAWKIGYSLDAGWLIAAYIATSIAFLLPLFTFKPWGERVEKMMDKALDEGRILPEQRAILNGARYRISEVFMYGLLVFIAYDMVFKPF